MSTSLSRNGPGNGNGPDRVPQCQGEGDSPILLGKIGTVPDARRVRLLEKTPNAPQPSFVPEAFRDVLRPTRFPEGQTQGIAVAWVSAGPKPGMQVDRSEEVPLF